MKALKNQIRSDLSYLVSVGEINPDQMIKVFERVEKAINSWSEQATDELKQLAKDWENTMGDLNESFYSLGVRRAIDVVTGESELNRLPILETDDTPDSRE